MYLIGQKLNLTNKKYHLIINQFNMRAKKEEESIVVIIHKPPFPLTNPIYISPNAFSSSSSQNKT